MNRINSSTAAALLFAVSTAWISPIQASEPAAELELQIKELQQQIQQLQTRIEKLEGHQSSSATTGEPGTKASTDGKTQERAETRNINSALEGLATLKQQWHSIDSGMSNEDIRNLLGPPSREFSLDGKNVWYYNYPGIGNGSVLFSPSGKVTGWQHPPFSIW